MTQPTIIIQASSRSWSGGPDFCLNMVEGQPAVIRSIELALAAFPGSPVVLAAPEFDRGGALDRLTERFHADQLRLYYGQDDSPLNRMLAAAGELPEEAYLIRIDGVHFCFDGRAAQAMLVQAQSAGLDCVKPPGDFPVQFGVDIYRVGALRRLDRVLNDEADRIFRIHPKFFMFAHPELFRCAYIDQTPEYSASYLQQCRERARFIYAVPRLEVNAQGIWAGDQLSFHYELAANYLQPFMKVLDIACGDGYGARKLSGSVAEIHGGDIDAENIIQARKLTSEINVQFHVEDVTALSFPDSSFDAVVSLETIEHVDAKSCLCELYRVLRPGGVLVLSTPQNKLGHIPVNTAHLREYSLAEITAFCSRHFIVTDVIGIKAGRVVIDGDPIGSNTVLICQKMN